LDAPLHTSGLAKGTHICGLATGTTCDTCGLATGTTCDACANIVEGSLSMNWC